jgi:hypothetical protein
VQDEDGRLVLVAGGRYAEDLGTGDVSFTPGLDFDRAAVICPALDGAPHPWCSFHLLAWLRPRRSDAGAVLLLVGAPCNPLGHDLEPEAKRSTDAAT